MHRLHWVLRVSSYRFDAATRHTGDSEHRESSPSLGDKSTLHAKGLLLPLVGVEAGVKVEPATMVLQVMHELMDGNVILRGVGQVLPEENDITVLVQPKDRTWSVVLARPVAEPALRFPLHLGKVIGERIAGQLGGPGHHIQNPFLHALPRLYWLGIGLE